MTENERLQMYFQQFCTMLKQTGLVEAVITFKGTNDLGVMHVSKTEEKSPLLMGMGQAIAEILREHMQQTQNN